MNLEDVMNELKALGSSQTVKTFRNHGAQGELYGVKVGDLKPIAKRLKKRQELAMQLWDTNNSDAMYLASLVADGSQMSVKQLNHWAKTASWYMLSEYAVPFVAAEHGQAVTLASNWIGAKQAHTATSGWTTYAATVSVFPDERLNLDQISELLESISSDIHNSANRVRYTMNGFVIAVGTYVRPLLPLAKKVARQIGVVAVDMGTTSCKVPHATEYIAKIEAMDRVGKKRKTARC
ncbi:MAG: DNA alkylation repair protein [Planctomycetota bacterium]|nr:DNA alkylation repair protein [Planctomycetota bacterium]MDA1178427.1 DNA alkylation repair protein [Planctomycetota bacterium]